MFTTPSRGPDQTNDDSFITTSRNGNGINVQGFTTLSLDLKTEDLSIQSLVSDELYETYQLVCYSIICQFINVFGIGTNIINIICFLRQGFKEPINVSLFGLAIADLSSLIPAIITGILLMKSVQQLDLMFDPIDVTYLVAYLRLVLTRITSFITAFIMLEKCLCITMPLKVGSIFTSRKVATMLIFITIALFLCSLPFYLGGNFGLQYSPEKNKTLVRFILKDNKMMMEQISFTINLFIIPVCSLTIVIVCMTIIALSLKKQSKWRSSLAGSKATQTSLEREAKVAKMVVMISSLFVACYAPTTIQFFVIAWIPELAYNGKHQNISVMIHALSQILESANLSMNFFIYYSMSSRYRSHFRALFSMKESVTPEVGKSVKHQ